MIREEAFKLVKDRIKNNNLIKHSLAVEAVMIALAKYLNQDVLSWSLAGLLHDIDYEETKDKPSEHSKKGAAILQDLGLSTEIVQAVKVHNEIHGLARESLMDKALYAADPLTGLITAGALILPTRKLSDLSAASILKRFKEPRFAASVNREAIQSIEELNITLEQFVEIGFKAMQAIASDLSL